MDIQKNGNEVQFSQCANMDFEVSEVPTLEGRGRILILES